MIIRKEFVDLNFKTFGFKSWSCKG